MPSVRGLLLLLGYGCCCCFVDICCWRGDDSGGDGGGGDDVPLALLPHLCGTLYGMRYIRTVPKIYVNV